MSFSAWLFLYLAGLIELDTRYRLSLHHPAATLIMLLPLLALTAPLPRYTALRWLGALSAVSCAIVLARLLSLDYWNTERIDLALLAAGVGFGGLLAIRDEESFDPIWELCNWLVIAAGWLVGVWLPLGPWIAMGAAATLIFWPRTSAPIFATAGLSSAWLLFWIGMAISKPWWDFDAGGEWIVAVWALGVAFSYLPRLRRWRAPKPLVLIALWPLLYPWIPHALWAAPLGLISGWALQASARPWHRAAGYGLLAGMILSYLMHSNLELFGPLVWGSR